MHLQHNSVCQIQGTPLRSGSHCPLPTSSPHPCRDPSHSPHWGRGCSPHSSRAAKLRPWPRQHCWPWSSCCAAGHCRASAPRNDLRQQPSSSSQQQPGAGLAQDQRDCRPCTVQPPAALHTHLAVEAALLYHLKRHCGADPPPSALAAVPLLLTECHPRGIRLPWLTAHCSGRSQPQWAAPAR